MIRYPPSSTPFPYTTLFRSIESVEEFREPEECTGKTTERPRAQAQRAGLHTVRPGHRYGWRRGRRRRPRSEEHTSELQSRENLVCRLLLEKKKHTIPANERM